MSTENTSAPITGREDLNDCTDPKYALSQFYRAFNTHDIALMEQNWDNSPDVAMDNPLGGIKRGWSEIRTVYEQIFQGKAKVEVEFYDYTMHLNDEMFYAVGRERGTLEAGKNKLELAIRTTRIFRRSGGCWRQVHHHGSMDDPNLLAAYQAAVSTNRELTL